MPVFPPAYLAAGMVLAIVPIHILCPAMVIRMDQLMGKHHVDLLLEPDLIVANHHLRGRTALHHLSANPSMSTDGQHTINKVCWSGSFTAIIPHLVV